MSSSGSFVEESPWTCKESHYLVLHAIYCNVAGADSFRLRDWKEAEVIVACKYDCLPVFLPTQDQPKERFKLICVPTVLLSVQFNNGIQ